MLEFICRRREILALTGAVYLRGFSWKPNRSIMGTYLYNAQKQQSSRSYDAKFGGYTALTKVSLASQPFSPRRGIRVSPRMNGENSHHDLPFPTNKPKLLAFPVVDDRRFPRSCRPSDRSFLLHRTREILHRVVVLERRLSRYVRHSDDNRRISGTQRAVRGITVKHIHISIYTSI